MSKKRRRKALDTETTGVDFFHGCRPFYVSITKDDGSVVSIEWDMDPFSRMPIVDDDDRHLLWQEMTDPDWTLVLTNAKFDMRAVHTIIPDLPWREIFERTDDTILKHHCLDSGESHKLKDAALKYANIPDDDQKTLKDACNTARKYGKKLGWAIASDKTLPLQKKAPKDGWWVVDMWTPRQYMLHIWVSTGDEKYRPPHLWDNPNDSHPWWRLCGIYCNRDTYRSLMVDQIFNEALEDEGLLEIYEERRQQLPIIYEGEQRGLTTDVHAIDKEIVRCNLKIDEYSAHAARLAGRSVFNIRSSKQLQEVLFRDFQLPVIKQTDTGAPSTDKDVMADLLKHTVETTERIEAKPIKSPQEAAELRRMALAHELVLTIVSGAKHMTAVNYMEGYKRAVRPFSRRGDTEFDYEFDMVAGRIAPNKPSEFWHRLHSSINPTGTATTRYSSQNPNMQNVGKGKEAFIDEIKELVAELSLRKLFGPAPWREWWAVDGKQLQLVIFAYISGQKEMIAALERGEDIHDFVQRVVFGDKYDPKDDGQRRIAKAVNFGRIFGAGDSKIELTARMPGLCAMLDKRLPGIKEFMNANTDYARRHGYVEAAGYRLMVPQDTLYAATNYIVQGWEGRIVQRAMIYWNQYLKENCPDAYIPLQVHDELIVDFPKGQGDIHIANLCDLFRKAGRELSVPCDVDAKYIETRWDKGIPVVVDPTLSA